MTGHEQEKARLERRIEELERLLAEQTWSNAALKVQLASKPKAGDAYERELLGRPAPPRSDLDDTIRAAVHQLDGIRAFPHKEARHG